MLPIHKVIWHEWRESTPPVRIPEPSEAMEDPDQIRAYVKAYEWGGPTSALQLHHLRELSLMIRPGDTVLDLACGPGPLLLELAVLYPDCRFIGADLSQPMLDTMMAIASERGLRNVTALREDITVLASVPSGSIDLVISTSALHHLPDLSLLQAAFRRIQSSLKPDGGFYIFDFGLLKSPETQQIMVDEVAKLAMPITVQDYAHSLRAAFPVHDVISSAREGIPRTFKARLSSFVNFFYFLQTEARAPVPPPVADYIKSIWRNLSLSMKLEHMMLRTMRREVTH
jgi:arsenite methyltransferase